MVLLDGTLPQSYDNFYTGYFQLIHNKYKEMQVIFAIHFNWMDKAIGQCKSGKLLEMFGNMTIRIMARCPRAQIKKWQQKYHTLKVSNEMFTANMQSLILNAIDTGTQIMYICNYGISNSQWTSWYIYMKWHLSPKQRSAVWLSWVNHNII